MLWSTLGLVAMAATGLADGYSGTRHLWYNTPGYDFNSALAIGNGRLGALVLGSASERIILNEDSVWNGTFKDRTNPNSRESFPLVRQLLQDGDITEAGKLVLQDMSSIPELNKAFSVTNDLLLSLGHSDSSWSNYERWLDTTNGNTGVSYTYDGTEYTREAIANFPIGVLAFRLTASEEGALDVNVTLSRDRGILENTADANTKTVTMNVGGDDAGSIAFSSAVQVETNGDITVDGATLVITGATTVDLFYDAETEFQWDSEEEYKTEVARKLDTASEIGFGELRSQAIADHSKLMERVVLDLGSSGETGLLPTDERIESYRESPAKDNEFITLMFNFGRHLLVSSSRDTGGPGRGVPAHLQGLWNDKYVPPWGSKYTVNINTEMNYWLAETTNLVETLRPLWDLMGRSYEKGKEVAQNMYGCPGYVSHHNLDLWGDSTPHDNGTKWTMWPMSNLWLLSHMTEHYHFTGDEDFLREKAWPLFQAAGEFFDCYVFEFDGYTSTGPSISPENAFIVPEGMNSEGAWEAIDISPTMDNSLLYEFFTSYMEIASILGVPSEEDDFIRRAQTLRNGLRPPQVGQHGQLMEWRNDYEEDEPAHRHLSHLWDLFPGSRFSPHLNKSLADASRVAIERRLDAGGASTGWSRAWTAACYARLLDGDQALNHTRILLQNHPLPNLFHGIEDWETFQIDSNFGLVAVVVESLLQSHAGLIHLLPALGSGIPAGSVSGLVARGGFEVALEWDDEGKLVKGEIKSRRGGNLSLRVGDGIDFRIEGKGTEDSSGEGVETSAGETYTITLE